MSGAAEGPFGASAKHGTQSGYVTHRNYGQVPCEPCTLAHREWSLAEYYRLRSGFRLTHAEALEALRSRAGHSSPSTAGEGAAAARCGGAPPPA